MKLYEEYYGKELSRSWVFNNLKDGNFVYTIVDDTYPNDTIIILAAFSDNDKEEKSEFVQNLRQTYKGKLGIFRSEYSDIEEFRRIKSKRIVCKVGD